MHFTTLDSLRFTFAGVGEYVLLRSNVEVSGAPPLTVHVRTALSTEQTDKVTVVT